jgi:predicted nucleotidyltransferase
MLEDVMNTDVKARIMKFISKFPEGEFQAADIARKSGLSISRTSECLKDLAGKGVLQSRKIGKGYLFKANRSNYLTKIILDAFSKEEKFVDMIAKDFVSRTKKLGRIKSIVLFGSSLKELGFGSDIDFLVVSEDKIESSVISGISAELTGKYGFLISPVSMTTGELRRKRNEGFVLGVAASSKVVFGKKLEDLIYG